MKRLNPVSFLLIASVLILGACQTSRGYSPKSWEQSNAAQQPAEAPPRELSEIYAQKIAEQQQADLGMQEQTAMAAQPAFEPEPQPVVDNLPEVKVAILLPLSGKQESLGQSLLKAAQMAVFEIGHNNFELMPRDTAGTPDGARKAAESALQDGAQLILGPVFAEEVKNARPVAERAGVNLIAFSTDWTLAGGNTFIMGFLPFDQIDRITRYAAAHGVRNPAVLASDNDYGRAVVTAYRDMAPRAGLNTSVITTFPSYTNNLPDFIRRFARYDERDANIRGTVGVTANMPLPFDAVLMPVGGDLAISIGNLLSQYDLPPSEVRRLGTGLFDDPALAADPSMNGAWFAAPAPAARENFERSFLTNFGYTPPRLASLGYDAAALAAVLAQRGLMAGGNPAFDRGAIMNPNGFAGIDGIFRFRPNGTAERGLAVLEYRNGAITVIDDAPKTFQEFANY